MNSPFLVRCSDYQKRHQLTPHYGWLWTLVQTVNRTSGRSGSASVDDPAERGCSRSRTTLGSVPSTSGEDRTWLQVLEGATTCGGQAFQWVSVSELLELCYISRNDPVFWRHSLVSIQLLIHLSTHICHHPRSHLASLFHSFTPCSKPTFSIKPSHLRLILPTGLHSW